MTKEQILSAFELTNDQLTEKGFNFEDLYIIGRVDKEYYKPSETYEYYYNGDFYNLNGQLLRNPEQYNPRSEGYTPFGDE